MATDIDKKIKDEQAKLKKYSFASYDSKKRGYIVNGKVYTKSQLDDLISQSDKAIKDFESQKKSGVASEFREFDIQSSLGAEYDKLVKIATDIKVDDYSSAIESLRAWRNVQTFVEDNPNIKSVQVVTKNPSVLEISTAWLRTGVGPKYEKVTKDVDPKNVQKNVDAAVSNALAVAEKDTTDSSQKIQVVKAGKTLVKNRKVVTDEPTLVARQSEIDSIKSGQEPPEEVATSARKGVATKSNIVLQPSSKTAITTTPATPATPAAPATPATPATAKAASAGDFRKAEGFAPGKPKKPSKPGKPTKPGTDTSAGTVVIDGKKVAVGSEQWKTIIQQEFGSMWDVYNSNPDVKAVIDKSVKEGYYNDTIKMEASLQNTGWFRTTQQSARQFAIQQSTDPATLETRVVAEMENVRVNAMNQGVTFSDATLRKLATDSIKFNWSDQQKLNALGSEQVAQAQLGGPQGMADLRRSGTARNLRQKASTFFQKPSEDLIESWTQQILLGQKSEQQWDELMRSSARTQFRSLQPALDKGDDVDTAMYAYKQQAQSILGSAVDTSQIDWTNDKWNKALNYRDEKTGEYRQMDLWEWNKYLRTLPEWQNTQEAKDAYRNVAFNLAQGFGKMA